MYNATFGAAKDNPPFAEPYVASFCSVDKRDSYIASHGLLSQWRGYGTQGGYIITFDTAGLIQLLHEEGPEMGLFSPIWWRRLVQFRNG